MSSNLAVLEAVWLVAELLCRDIPSKALSGGVEVSSEMMAPRQKPSHHIKWLALIFQLSFIHPCCPSSRGCSRQGRPFARVVWSWHGTGRGAAVVSKGVQGSAAVVPVVITLAAKWPWADTGHFAGGAWRLSHNQAVGTN